MCARVIIYSMRRIVWLLMTVLVSYSAQAQYDVAFGHYWALQPYYNPAASGLSRQINVQAAYSMQMTGFKNAPATMYAGVDLPLFFFGPRHGAGVGFLNDEIGLFSNKELYLQYAYHQSLLGGQLSVGVRASMLNDSFDGTKLDIIDSGDPAFATNEVNGSAFDLGAGVRYTYRDVWYAGLSAMHLASPTINLGDDKMHQVQVNMGMYATGGYTVKFKQPVYKLLTSAMFRTDMQAWRADLTARLAYDGTKNKLYAGLGYSPMNSVTVLFGMDFHGVKLGYSYEIYTSAIGALHGTHELTLGYQTDMNLFKKGKNRHKSVRLL